MQGLLSAAPAGVTTSRRAAQRRLAFVVGVAAFWLLLAALDIPKPHWDDIWYTDPAINIAVGGGLESPVLERIFDAFGTRQYLLTFPFHAFVLGGWLRLFGVSTPSVLLFSSACGTLASLGLAAVLELLEVPVAAIVASIAFYALHMTAYGLRTEMLGCALGFAGLAMAVQREARTRIAGIVVAAAGALTAPNLTGFLPVLLLALLAMVERPGDARARTRALVREAIAGGALAGAILVPLFLVSIRGHVHDFLVQTNAMRHQTSLSGPGSWLYFRNVMRGRGWDIVTAAWMQRTCLEGPLWAAFFPAYGATWLPAARDAIAPRLRAFGHAILVALPITLLYRHVSYDLLSPFVFAWLAGAALTVRARPAIRAIAVGVVPLVFLYSTAHRLILLTCIAPPPSRAEVDRVRQEALASGKRLFIDEVSARYVYGFAYPRTALSYRSQMPSPVKNELAPISGLPPLGKRPDAGEIWVVSQANLCRFAGGGPPCASLRVAGVELTGAYADPLALAVVQ